MEDDSESADGEDDKDPMEQIHQLMDGLPCWDVKGDDESIDFYRTYSMDYPYCEGHLHSNATQMTLYFTGKESRVSVTLTMSLVKCEEQAEQKATPVNEKGEI